MPAVRLSRSLAPPPSRFSGPSGAGYDEAGQAGRVLATGCTGGSRISRPLVPCLADRGPGARGPKPFARMPACRRSPRRVVSKAEAAGALAEPSRVPSRPSRPLRLRVTRCRGAVRGGCREYCREQHNMSPLHHAWQVCRGGVPPIAHQRPVRSAGFTRGLHGCARVATRANRIRLLSESPARTRLTSAADASRAGRGRARQAAGSGQRGDELTLLGQAAVSMLVYPRSYARAGHEARHRGDEPAALGRGRAIGVVGPDPAAIRADGERGLAISAIRAHRPRPLSSDAQSVSRPCRQTTPATRHLDRSVTGQNRPVRDRSKQTCP